MKRKVLQGNCFFHNMPCRFNHLCLCEKMVSGFQIIFINTWVLFHNMQWRLLWSCVYQLFLIVWNFLYIYIKKKKYKFLNRVQFFSRFTYVTFYKNLIWGICYKLNFCLRYLYIKEKKIILLVCNLLCTLSLELWVWQTLSQVWV